MNKHIFKKNSPSVSHTILVFPHQIVYQYSDGDPLTGALNPSVVGKHRDTRPVSGFIACCQRFDRQLRQFTSYSHSCTGPSQVGDTHRCKRRRLLFEGDDDEVFMTRRFDVTPKATEQNCTQW